MKDDYDDLVKMRDELRSKKTTTETVTRAKEEGLVLAEEERWALWRLACGRLPVDEYLGEEPNEG